MKPPRRAIYSYVCGGLHSLDHAALTSFEHERAHYGARLSPFVPHSERRQLDMTTTSAVLSAYPLWSRLSTTVLSASPHFGRGQVRGAPCTESISTLVAAESTRSTGWAALARSMARSSMAKIEHGAEHTPQVHRRIRSHHRQRRSATPARDSMRMAPTHCGEDSTPRFTPSCAQGWATQDQEDGKGDTF
jgi:hypothetical protein